MSKSYQIAKPAIIAAFSKSKKSSMSMLDILKETRKQKLLEEAVRSAIWTMVDVGIVKVSNNYQFTLN